MSQQCRYKCNARKQVFMEGLGRFVDCPECRNITKLIEVPDDSGESIYDKLRIPPQYKGVGTAGQELFHQQGLMNFSANSLNEVGSMFERINKDIYSGRVTQLSSYFYTSLLVDYKRFVYGAQRLAVEKELGVTPFISCNTLYGLQRVVDFNIRDLSEVKGKPGEMRDIPPDLVAAVEGYKLIQATGLSYFDFIHADVCFVEATSNTTDKGWAALADLMGERSKEGLPTYVMGYWPAKSSSWSGSRGLRYLVAPEQSLPRLELLTPYELKAKSNGADDMQIQRAIQIDTTNSTVSAGLSTSKFISS